MLVSEPNAPQAFCLLQYYNIVFRSVHIAGTGRVPNALCAPQTDKQPEIGLPGMDTLIRLASITSIWCYVELCY